MNSILSFSCNERKSWLNIHLHTLSNTLQIFFNILSSGNIFLTYVNVITNLVFSLLCYSQYKNNEKTSAFPIFEGLFQCQLRLFELIDTFSGVQFWGFFWGIGICLPVALMWKLVFLAGVTEKLLLSKFIYSFNKLSNKIFSMHFLLPNFLF